MTALLLFFIGVLLIVSPFCRTVLFNFYFTLFYVPVDLFRYIFYRLKYKMPTGRLDCYCADFGGGKTLSMAQYLYKLNKKYDGKKYYDSVRKIWIKQHVVVLSNFTVNKVDCVPLSTLQDVVNFANVQKDYDAENGTRTCLIVAIDEASCQLNSRNFKNNIDPLFLNTLITCRHYNINFIYSSQTFFLTDKLLRDVTQRVIWCKKIWRVMELFYYDAHVVENAGSIETIKPKRKRGWFIRDFHFKLYDTLSCVDNLTKDGSMLSYEEILANRGAVVVDEDAVRGHKFRRYRKAK